MNQADSIFLRIFKDIKMVEDKHNSTEGKPSYNCFIGTQLIGHRKVVEMVKQCQDEIIKMLLESGSEE